ncbi:hypothetical protein AWC38_SpisGene9389 [Stylophora pistillata]|uniref:Uncharacterized protein n=1 Tax=Stylophora pistillata TaxID=50429 RepID=A0A2B4S977_STYPI|nr:hypothetical protein AWC38_SpisGene9389 [Stylophora pistillata]
MVILKMRPISFVVLVFIANLTGVVDLFNEGACNWSCEVENANATGEALKKAMAEGRLLKLAIMYKERVESERCANETKQDTIITNTTLKVFLNFIDHQANRIKDSMAFITQSILEVIFSGKVFTGSYIEMKVSCISEPTSVKNFSTNFSYQRLTPLHSPQSILYYIENLASYTKTTSTLVLVRVDQHTRISLVTTSAAGNRSSHKDNELLTFSDGWLAIVIIIWIIFALYSPLIFLLFRPSKLKVKLPENHLPTPVEEAEDDGGYIERRRQESRPSPTENEDDENNQFRAEGEFLPERRDFGTEEAVRHTISNDSGAERTRLFRVGAATCCSVYSDLGNTDDHNSYSSHDGAIADEEHAITNSSYTLITPRPETCMIPISPGADEENSSSDERLSCIVDGREQNPPRQPVQPSSVSETSEANYTHLIIAGDTNPIGVGSFIVWLILIWGIGCAVPLAVLLIGTIKNLASNTNEMLPEVIIIIFSVHYLLSCHGAFTNFYYDLANKLASSYQKKYDEKNQSERDDLIYYRLGKEEHSIKVIPEELFKNALKERKLLVRIKVAYLLVKLFFTFLSLTFVWPIISSEAVMAQSSPEGVLAITITFFAVAYPLINNRINGEKLDVSTEDVDKIVDDYIKERIRSKRGHDL